MAAGDEAPENLVDRSMFSFDGDGASDRTVRRASLESFTEVARLTVAADSSGTASSLPTGERYADHGEIGRGGMGSVRRVLDRVILRHAALKELDDGLAERASALTRFLEEAQITGQLDHPNIVPVYDIGVSSDGEPTFFTMKLVEGSTLTRVIAEPAPGKPSDRHLEWLLQIFLKVCDATSFAHSRGVVHRDLKPDNVMVGAFGQVYVMDWGIAKLVGDGGAGDEPSSIKVARHATGSTPPDDAAILGTPAYMAPEQAWGFTDQIHYRTDVFGLGAILYHVLTGVAPLRASSFLQTMQRARTADIKPPQETERGARLPPGLCRIAMKAMSAKPDDRYESVEQLKSAVEEFLRGGGWFSRKRFGPRDVIVAEGEPASAAYIINRGRCQVQKTSKDGDKVNVRELGPGDVFGETAIVTERPRSATVVAIDEVDVTVVTRESLQNELARSEWMRAIVTALAERFRELDGELDALRRR